MAEPLCFMVTGAASGIGRHLVGAALTRGHRVLASDLRREALEEARRAEAWPPARTRLAALDVRDPLGWQEALEQAVQQLGGLDVLVNCAGYLQAGWFHEAGPAEVERHLDVNVKGVLHGCRTAAAWMVPRGRGHLVNIASLAGVAPVPGLALYAASKFAVRGFSLSIAGELAPHGVAVTCLAPDAVRTPMLAKQVDQEAAALTFSGARTLEVEDIARALFEVVLPRRPVELLLPADRGWMAKLASAFPGLAEVLRPHLVARGRRRQRDGA